jgi:hypothetical protein
VDTVTTVLIAGKLVAGAATGCNVDWLQVTSVA